MTDWVNKWVMPFCCVHQVAMFLRLAERLELCVVLCFFEIRYLCGSKWKGLWSVTIKVYLPTGRKSKDPWRPYWLLYSIQYLALAPQMHIWLPCRLFLKIMNNSAILPMMQCQRNDTALALKLETSAACSTGLRAPKLPWFGSVSLLGSAPVI